ncbi:alpha/beta hydrolase [Nocardioides caeni]|uniref:Acyl-CoA:diacylglycerol acyltransferase n=1 Tax=Nocardioides caeni TaxID=574700 RepID=A0A4S8N0L3_9ACTN|nr:alpha/beta hydrolase-fold protein [Nocardioides caeni]THV09308.1 esterase [Nocardioides caeni]
MAEPKSAGRPRRVTRRRLLGGSAAVVTAGAAALAGVELEVLPGKSTLYHRLGHDGEDGVVPSVEPGRLDSGAFASRARGREVGWAVARPPRSGAAAPLPVVLVLHGRGNDHRMPFQRDGLGLDRFLARAVDDGLPPFALASVDGGEAYWHDRADGDRAQTMVLDEFLPLLADQGLDTSRIALAGWSMGGFGALHLGAVLGPERVAAVAALSPALWHDYDDTAPGAYDDADDFDRVSVMDRQADLDGIAVRVDCGQGDPFCAAGRDYVDGFDHRPAGGFQLGDHDRGYWRRMAPDVLQFVGEALAG